MEPKSGNYRKYTSKNPLMRRAVGNFVDCVGSMAASVGARTVLDAGCGEGFVAGRLANERLVGMDKVLIPLMMARHNARDVLLVRGNVYHMPFKSGSFDLVIMSEVLEHLDTPEVALAEAARVSKMYCIFSVPHEPFFRITNLLRGKNIICLGNDAEHIQHWTKSGFVRFVSRDFDVLRADSVYPWTLVLCQKRH